MRQAGSQNRDAKWGFWGAVLAAAILATATYLARPRAPESIPHAPGPSGPSARSEERAREIVPTISEPEAGTAVGPTAVINGASPFPNVDHYVLVTSIKTGTRYVVNRAFRPNPDGSFSAGARFGTGDIGIGEEFSIEVVTTTARLAEGPLDRLPQDAKASPIVTVRRTH